jgi:hypothetical protein
VTVFRGGPGVTPQKASAGISWTLDRSVAEFFAESCAHLTGAGMVISGNIPRSAIVAYFNDRSEHELIVEWRKARSLRIVNEEMAAGCEAVAGAGP